jgi:hypothetical protein
MDLSTMRNRLDAHKYSSPQALVANFKLMIHNCFHFNPPGTPVNLAGIMLQRLFDEKWKNLPQPKPQPLYDNDMDIEDASGGDHNQQRTLFVFFAFLLSPDAHRLLGTIEVETQIEGLQRHDLHSETTDAHRFLLFL